MGSKRETSGVTELANPRPRPGGERPTAPTATARPGAGPRLATGDLPVAELGGGALIGAAVGRLIGGGLRGAALGAAVGAAAGTAVGLVTGGLLGGGSTHEERSRREPAFGPRVDPDKRTAPVSPAGPPKAAEERGEAEAAAEPATEAAAKPATEQASEPATDERAEPAATGPESSGRQTVQSPAPEEEASIGGEPASESTAETQGEGRPETPDFASWTKAELYEEAKRRDIEGRSTMTKAELIAALRRATFHT